MFPEWVDLLTHFLAPNGNGGNGQGKAPSGYLHVLSEPAGVTVFIDDSRKPVGKTDAVIELPEGQYVLRLQIPEGPVVKHAVTIRAGGITKVHVRFRRREVQGQKSGRDPANVWVSS
jgi:hypothetical protein